MYAQFSIANSRVMKIPLRNLNFLHWTKYIVEGERERVRNVSGIKFPGACFTIFEIFYSNTHTPPHTPPRKCLNMAVHIIIFQYDNHVYYFLIIVY